MEDLEAVFKSVDIEGEGKLDEGSFITALKALKVQVEDDELAGIFEQLDENEEGYIEYEKLLQFLQLGKIPSSLLNRVKKSKVPRKSIIIGGSGNDKGVNLLNRVDKEGAQKGGLKGAPQFRPVNEKFIQMQQAHQNMEPARRKMIQRAVIVIKKAAMKNIPRPEVVEFLTDKGMSKQDIEHAYLKAQEQVMSPEERVKYLTDLADSRLKEVTEQQKVNKYLTNELTTHTREIDILRNLLRTSADVLMEKFPLNFKDQSPKTALKELQSRIDSTKDNIAKAQGEQNDRAVRVHQRDLEMLAAVDKCMQERRFFHGHLFFYCLDEVIREGMPQLSQFLANYTKPPVSENNEEYD
jgi:hypothetical protein